MSVRLVNNDLAGILFPDYRGSGRTGPVGGRGFPVQRRRRGTVAALQLGGRWVYAVAVACWTHLGPARMQHFEVFLPSVPRRGVCLGSRTRFRALKNRHGIGPVAVHVVPDRRGTRIAFPVQPT